MKRRLFTIAMFSLVLGGILTSCNSPQEKATDAREDFVQAQANLEQHKADSMHEVDWQAFKTASINRIAANKVEITALRDKKAAKGNIMDPVYAQQIVDLEHKNTAMQNRIDDYEKYNSSWEEFKRDFTREMDELGESLKGVGSDNSK
ncbi:MAG: hypothetical protein IPN95_08570 [Bacteroidetes bacterium]|nr:hypothetical protein [Bacteroidota bacterium]MBP6641018.1 hypothetical protein [Bacteroidia bacterium]